MDPSLSPDGTKLAYLTSTGRDLALAVYHLDTGKGEVLCRVDSHTNAFSWKDNSRILYIEAFYNEKVLRSVSIGQHTFNSFPGYGDKRKIGAVINWLPADPNHILVQMGRIGLMDVETGAVKQTEPVGTEQFVGPYIPDATGTLRLRCTSWADGIELQHRRSDNDRFATVYKWKWEDPNVVFLGFGGDPNLTYFVTHDEGDWGVVHGFDTRTFKLGPALVSLRDAEILSAHYSRDGSTLIGFVVSGKNGSSNFWLDATMRRNQAVIDASLPGHDNRIVSWSEDLNSLVILSAAGSEPGVYYSLDMRRKALVKLGSRHPQVDSSKLGKVSVAEIPARDGMTVHGILTVPPGDSKGPFPLVLLPQDRMFGVRWDAIYSPLNQYLASRGYAVLDVDYRGSWGYGKAFEDAGRFEIAGKIPNDVEDAALWSIKAGYATKGRIGILGGDFGGTLALIAATYTPDLYCCVINQQGEPDLTRLGGSYDWNASWLTRKRLETFIGNNTKALSLRSPLLAIDRIRAPILNIYWDPEHDQSWNRLEAGLRRNRKPYELYKILPPTNEYLPIDERVNYFRQVGDFLEKNLSNVAAN